MRMTDRTLPTGEPQPPIRFEDDRFFAYPAIRWSLSHLPELARTAIVAHRPGVGSAWHAADSSAEAALDALPFMDLDGHERTWSASLADTYADGIVVLHRGRCLYEKYFGALESDWPHACFSITKSYVATLAAALVHEGALDGQARISHYLPELAGTAFADASLREVMDMQVGIDYAENYADPDTDFWAYSRASGLRPYSGAASGPRTIHEYLRGLKKTGSHGVAFAYKSVNTEVLSWVITRVCAESLRALLSRRIWSRIGCEGDANLVVDSEGTEMAGAGLCARLRDLARFGELMRCEGACQSTQVIPAAVVADIRRGGERGRVVQAGYQLLGGYSYRNMWWVSHNEFGMFEARGIHGQRLYIAPGAELVIARFASHPTAANSANDPISLPAFLALARHLA
jgi:CubicO group peptidase (beta-lactamase class C family)